MTPRRVAAAALTVLLCACRTQPPAHRATGEAIVVWKPIGSWSGRGNRQTETFTSDSGGFRVRWQTTHAARQGAGRLRVVFRSGDSGREIIEAIDAHGEGRGEEEVAAERPRWYYLTIESQDVDWVVAVDERIDATRN
jgi:hypothetical protein